MDKAAEKAVELLEGMPTALPVEDRAFVVQYAIHTGDMELVKKLADELAADGADREAVKTKYRQLCDQQPEWLTQVEAAAAVCRLYQAEQKKALAKIAEFLRAHGMEVSMERLEAADISEIRRMAEEADEQEKEEQYGRGNQGSSPDHRSSL